MNISELYPLLQQGLPKGELVLDVRDEDEFAEGHIDGALNIPHDRVAERASELKGYSRIYVHCGGGGRAGKAVEALQKAGLRNVVHICDSGMRSWIAAGYPVVK